MNAQPRIYLAQAIGALALLSCSALAIFASMRAWDLHQQVTTGQNAQLANDTEQANTQNYLVHASSHGAAGADLLTRLRTAARKASVSLARAEPRPVDPADTNSVKISAQASGTSRAIAAFLYEIEAKPPALVINRVRLNAESGDKTVSVDILVSARALYQENTK